MSELSTPAFYIREIPIYGDLILSPMAGFSDLPYRAICRELGSAMSYTEFVSAEALSHDNPKSWRFFDYAETERPIAFQFFDHDVERLVQQCQRAVELFRPDVIDINMGCSVNKVSQKGAGAGLLRTPHKIAEIFTQLATVLPVPVTGKIRLGWDDDSLNYLEVAHVLEDNGASAIAVHGRTKRQAYGGEARWSPIAEIKASVGIPVIGNGDVKCVDDIDRMKAQTQCDAVMIGRAAIGNPWIFRRQDRDEVTFAERALLIRRHLAAMLDYYGPDKGLVLFRKHVVKYIKGAPHAKDIHLGLVTCHTADEFIALFSAWEERHYLHAADSSADLEFFEECQLAADA